MAGQDENAWRTQALRQSVIAKIEEAIMSAGTPMHRNSSEMENHVFQRAKSKEEYLHFAARLILHVKEPRTQDPMSALQTLARQGTGNPQIMAMQGGGNPQGMGQQQPGNQNANLLQSANQRQVPGMPMANMQAKMQGMGMMPGQMGGPMGHMGPMQAGPMMPQMQQRGQAPMVPMGPGQMGQMGPGQMGQMTPQMQPNMQNPVVQNQQQGPMQNQLQGQMQHQMQAQMAGQMQMGPRMQPGPQMAQMVGGQPGSGQTPPQMGHMQRKPEMINVGFPGPRNVTPNQFLSQSPSPSAPSPANLGGPPSNQMIPSPALVPCPSPQHPMMAGQPRSMGMAPSPSSSLNTPGSVGPAPSPQEDATYREKVRQLNKYIEPLRQMITKMGNEGNLDKMAKMKRLLEILSNPTKRVPLETIIKCEMVLEKLNLKRGESSVGPPPTSTKEQHFFSPLLEAVNLNLQSPMANHTLQRTFGPCLEALVGPDILNLPSPLKKERVEESTSEIPDVLQGEIARLDQRFKVSLDPAQQNGSKCIQLICWLDDRHLPCVPPVSVTVPSEYPHIPPRCIMAPHDYTTTFLSAVQKALDARIRKLPERFSVSQLLDTWEMSVRQASAPTQTPVSASTVLLGI